MIDLKRENIFKNYLYLSLGVSFTLWTYLYFFKQVNFESMLFPSMFFYINLLALTNVSKITERNISNDGLIKFLFTQSFCLLLFSYSKLSSFHGNIYLSIVPILFGVELIKLKSGHLGQKINSKVLAIAVMFILAHWAITSIWFSETSYKEYGFFLLNFTWVMGSIIIFRDFNNIHSYKTSDVDEEKQMFVHDALNHTNGLLLYLNNKKRKSQEITDSENTLLIKEVESLQMMISDHFKLIKKSNSHEGVEFQNFYQVKDFFEKQIYNYINEEDCSLIYRGILSSASMANEFNILVPFITMNRILVNLAKNISEHSINKECEFIFSLEDDFLIIQTKNKIYQTENNEDVAFELKNKILKLPEVEEVKLGLSSISNLARVHQGSFHFEIEQGLWISNVKLKIKTEIKDQENVILDKIA